GLAEILKKPIGEREFEVYLSHKDLAPKVNAQLGGILDYYYRQGYEAQPIVDEDGNDIGLAKIIPKREWTIDNDLKDRVVPLDLTGLTNADYHYDPFVPFRYLFDQATGEELDDVYAPDHYPSLDPNGSRIFYKGQIPMDILPSAVVTKQPSILVTF